MEFLDISSLGTTYWYASKIGINSNRRSETLDLRIKSKGKVPPNRRKKDKTKEWGPKITFQIRKQRNKP